MGEAISFLAFVRWFTRLLRSVPLSLQSTSARSLDHRRFDVGFINFPSSCQIRNRSSIYKGPVRSPSSVVRVEVDVWFHPRMLGKFENAMNACQLHSQTNVKLQIHVVGYVFRIVVQIKYEFFG